VDYPVLGPDLVRLALAAGERARAEQVAAAVAEVAGRNDVPSMAGAALRCQGLVAGDPQLLRAAVDAYGQGSRPLELALAAEDAGVAFARRGRPDAAVPLLRQALEIHERLDAARDAARVEAGLRELGVRRGRRGPRGRPQLGWESLTSTERQVVDLVVEGLTNPQIGERLYVSRRCSPTTWTAWKPGRCSCAHSYSRPTTSWWNPSSPGCHGFRPQSSTWPRTAARTRRSPTSRSPQPVNSARLAAGSSSWPGLPLVVPMLCQPIGRPRGGWIAVEMTTDGSPRCRGGSGR
jgi:hypothetical protein